MGFFATFWSWLNGQLAAYIGTNTAKISAALEPAIVTFSVLYVMAWGYLHIAGRIEEPVLNGLKRIATVALILGISLNLWLYNTVIVDTFYRAPAELAAAVIGSADPVSTIDSIWESGGSVAGSLWTKGHLHFWGNGLGFMVAATVVWCLIGLLCVYAMFLIALSSIALAVLLALGPLFFAFLFFGATKRLFSAWLSQLATYSLITVITVMLSSLLLQVVKSYAAQTAARGDEIVTVDILDMMLIAALVFLILRQVMPIAAGLGGGVALSSFDALGRSARAAFGLSGPVRRPAAALVQEIASLSPLVKPPASRAGAASRFG
jgi:type IV secretion system protein VirB6